MHPQSTPAQCYLFDKRCARCGVLKPHANFTKRTVNADGLSSMCRSCESEHYKAYRARTQGRCAHDGCADPTYRRGLCSAHYKVAKATGEPAPVSWTAQKPLPILDPLDLAWLAGLFDGEGTVCIGRMRPRTSASNPHYELHVAVSMTSESAITALADAFGGNVCPFRSRRAHHKPQFRWRASQWRAVQFLRAVRPYLRIKTAQADLALEFMELNRNRHNGSRPLAPAELAEREALYEEMALLNDSHWRRRRARLRKVRRAQSGEQ